MQPYLLTQPVLCSRWTAGMGRSRCANKVRRLLYSERCPCDNVSIKALLLRCSYLIKWLYCQQRLIPCSCVSLMQNMIWFNISQQPLSRSYVKTDKAASTFLCCSFHGLAARYWSKVRISLDALSNFCFMDIEWRLKWNVRYETLDYDTFGCIRNAAKFEVSNTILKL